MKKFLVAILAVATLASFTGCAKSGSASTGSSTSTGSSEKIGVAMPTKSLQRWNEDGTNMKAQLEGKGYKVDLQYAENDVNTQVSQIENMITAGDKVLVVAAIDGSALTDALQKAADAGIKVIAYDRLIMNTPNVDYYATFDNFKVGVIQGQYVESKLGLKDGKGPFNMEIFGGSPDDNNAKVFNAGEMSVLKPYIDNGKLVVKSGQVDFDKVAISGWKSEAAQARMDNIITANYANGTKLDVVLSPNDSLAIGVVASLKSAGYGTADKQFPVLTGQDCDKPNVSALKNDQQSMDVFKDTRTLASKVVEMVSAIVSGKEAPVNDTKTYNNGSKVVPSFLCDPVSVTKDNYKQILIDSGYYKEADIQ
ncbi:MAG: sugar ABC transporter substrate-binding protein [Bacillota bacterium]|nr:sugar ABC transporter substrate-binding protein [Bacillota bacterium]